MIELPQVTPIKSRGRDLIIPTHIISASAYYSCNVLNSYSYFRFTRQSLYDFFQRVSRDNPDISQDGKSVFNGNLAGEIDYIFSEDRILVPHNLTNFRIYEVRRSFGIYYDRLDAIKKAKALELGVELFEEFGCDKHGVIGDTTPYPIVLPDKTVHRTVGINGFLFLIGSYECEQN